MAEITISQDLINFRDSVKPNIGTMRSACTTLSEGIQKIISATTSAKSKVESNYKSSNSGVVIGSIESLASNCEQIKTSIDSDLKGMVDQAEEIDTLVDELEELKEFLDAKQAYISANSNSEDDTVKQNVQTAKQEYYNKSLDFNTKHESAKQKLAVLKAKDTALPESLTSDESAGSSSGYTVDLSKLKFGVFEKRSFKASNKVCLDYYVYVPDYGEKVSGLPVMLYMHGASKENTGDHICIDNGLGQAIANHTITPSGIVVIPHVVNGDWYENRDIRDALAELPVAVCEEYNGDKNKISVGGLSYGAVTAVKLVNENPGVFCAVATACGSNEITNPKAWKGVKVWFTNGRRDPADGHTGRSYVKNSIAKIEAAGGDVESYNLYEDDWSHTNVGNKTFQYKIKNQTTGEEEYLCEWCFQQSKA